MKITISLVPFAAGQPPSKVGTAHDEFIWAIGTDGIGVDIFFSYNLQ
jgi:hypothetical protein